MLSNRVDIPQFTRCCFCIPLRYGVITCAYIKVGVLVLAAIANTAEAIERDDYLKAFPILMCIILYTDVISTLFCIVVGHLKHCRGLTIYYYISLGILIALITTSISFDIAVCIRYSHYRYYWVYTFQEIFATFIGIFSQVYFLLLVRSEILKLQTPPSLRFVNHEGGQAGKDDAIMEEREDTESRTGEDAFAYTY